MQFHQQQRLKKFRQKYLESLDDKFVESLLSKFEIEMKRLFQQRLAGEKPSHEQIGKNYDKILKELYDDINGQGSGVYAGEETGVPLSEILCLYQKYLYVLNRAKKNGYIRQSRHFDKEEIELMTKIFKLPEYKLYVDLNYKKIGSVFTNERCLKLDDEIKKQVKERVELLEKTRKEKILSAAYSELLGWYNISDRSKQLSIKDNTLMFNLRLVKRVLSQFF